MGYAGIIQPVTCPGISKDKYNCPDLYQPVVFLLWKIDRLIQVGGSQVNPLYPISHKKNQRVIPGYLSTSCKGHGTLFFLVFLTIQGKIDRNNFKLDSTPWPSFFRHFAPRIFNCWTAWITTHASCQHMQQSPGPLAQRKLDVHVKS